MNFFNPYQNMITPLSHSLFYRTSYSEPILSWRGAWTPLSWVEKYHYAFSGPFNTAEVALTFDDGPDITFTAQILEKLRKFQVKATFFLLGENMEKYPHLVRQIASEGHVIGNHTYSHPKLPEISDEAYHLEIEKADRLIQDLAGYKPRFFRPTYGAINESQVAWASHQGMMIIQWSIDTLDWQGLSAEAITKTVEANILPGSIILQHNADGVPLQGSVDALDLMIPALQQKGARFVTLSDMFGLTKGRT